MRVCHKIHGILNSHFTVKGFLSRADILLANLNILEDTAEGDSFFAGWSKFLENGQF